MRSSAMRFWAGCVSVLAIGAVGLSSLVLVSSAEAQSRGGRGGQQKDDDAKAAEKAKQDKEWKPTFAPLKKHKAEGACPYVKVLYDAARMVDFDGGKEASSSVKWSGEINRVYSDCQYEGEQPIKVQLGINFALGRGPKAEGDAHNYRYWVAVTERNNEILEKAYFDMPVKFQAGQDRQNVTQVLEEIVIPRAKATVSGSNFEILVGFDITPANADFNRDGKRFKVNAGAAQTTPGQTPGQ